jgi:8-oxo-dGTP pyrophosphatase MutT (NUDIX family)
VTPRPLLPPPPLQGEEYEDTAARELAEEIGVPPPEAARRLRRLFVFPYQDATCHVWGCAFELTWTGPVVFADAEVEWGRFVDLPELEARLAAEPGAFTPVGRHILGLYLQQRRREQGGGGGGRGGGARARGQTP